MKKKTVAVIVSILGILLLTGVAVLVFLKGRGILQAGTVVISEGSCIFLGDDTGGPVVVHNQTKDQELFSRLQTGDRVLVVGDGAMMLSYPAQMNIYFCLRLGSGDLSRVPEETLRELRDMGYSFE